METRLDLWHKDYDEEMERSGDPVLAVAYADRPPEFNSPIWLQEEWLKLSKGRPTNSVKVGS